MKAKKDKVINEGYCAICGEFRKLTFEHVPPQSAFNNKPIFYKGHEHLINKGGYLYGKKSLSSKGFGGYTLCELCNNNTGAWYAKDFSYFVHQGMRILDDLTIKEGNVIRVPDKVRGIYLLKPLNVIKQILSMFMSADKSGHLRSYKELVDFILIKDKKGLPTNFKVFLYSNISPNKRMLGSCLVLSGNNKNVAKWSEINFEPFGYLLAEESGPAHEEMLDISKFGECEYDQLFQTEIITAFLKVNSPYIGDYR